MKETSQLIAMENARKISKIQKGRDAGIGFYVTGKMSNDKKKRITNKVKIFNIKTGEEQTIFENGVHIKFRGFKKDNS